MAARSKLQWSESGVSGIGLHLQEDPVRRYGVCGTEDVIMVLHEEGVEQLPREGGHDPGVAEKLRQRVVERAGHGASVRCRQVGGKCGLRAHLKPDEGRMG